VRGILDKGLQRGELKKNLDLALFTDLIYGAIFYRLLVSGDPVDDNYVKQLFSACLKECVCLKANRLQPCGVCGGEMSSLYSDVPMHYDRNGCGHYEF